MRDTGNMRHLYQLLLTEILERCAAPDGAAYPRHIDAGLAGERRARMEKESDHPLIKNHPSVLDDR